MAQSRVLESVESWRVTRRLMLLLVNKRIISSREGMQNNVTKQSAFLKVRWSRGHSLGKTTE